MHVCDGTDSGKLTPRQQSGKLLKLPYAIMICAPGDRQQFMALLPAALDDDGRGDAGASCRSGRQARALAAAHRPHCRRLLLGGGRLPVARMQRQQQQLRPRRR